MSSGRNEICDCRWESGTQIFTEAPLSTANNKLKEKYLVLESDLTCKQIHLNIQWHFDLAD